MFLTVFSHKAMAAVDSARGDHLCSEPGQWTSGAQSLTSSWVPFSLPSLPSSLFPLSRLLGELFSSSHLEEAGAAPRRGIASEARGSHSSWSPCLVLLWWACGVIPSMAALWTPALHWPHLLYLYKPASSTDYWAPFVLGWQNQSCEEAKIAYSHQGLVSPVCFTPDNVLVTLQQVNAGAQSPECDVKVTWRCCVIVSFFYPTPQ